MLNINKIVDAYVQAALFTDTDGGDSSDVAESAFETARDAVEDFVFLAGDFLDGLDEDFIGHNLWFSRNGHGTGFWARGLGNLGEILHRHAVSLGESSLFLSDDDGMYYFAA